MNSFIIETRRNGLILPFIGFGFSFYRRKHDHGFGIVYIGGLAQTLLVCVWFVFEFRSLGLNPKIYRREAWKKYFKKDGIK